MIRIVTFLHRAFTSLVHALAGRTQVNPADRLLRQLIETLGLTPPEVRPWELKTKVMES